MTTSEREYEPSPAAWVREQVELYEATNGAQGATLRETGLPVIIVRSVGRKSGKLRKTPLMKVHHEGSYALVASKGGADEHPVWYYNLLANPGEVWVQDGAQLMEVSVRELSGAEYEEWWERAVAAFPDYATYRTKTDRQIPVFVATPTVS
jgi:deazaflavin-dependent oxidoreductase (nitroreductase family)